MKPPKPQFPRPKSKRLPEREDMTLCIAALAVKPGAELNQPSVVFCSDARVETQATGSETLFKFRKISNHWAGMLAGTVGRADELLDIYGLRLPNEPPDDGTIIEQLRIPPQEFKKRLASEYVANMTGMSFDEFLSRGQASLPSGLFENISNDIARIDIGCQLILVPLPARRRIYAVDTNGSISVHENFCAIGSGASNAEAWLYYREQERYSSLARTMIHLLEAKRFSANAPGVGKKTTLLFVDQDLKMHGIQDEDNLEAAVWKRYGPKSTDSSKIKYTEYETPVHWNEIRLRSLHPERKAAE